MNPTQLRCPVCKSWVAQGSECNTLTHQRILEARGLIESGVVETMELAARLGVSGRQARRYIRAAGAAEETRRAPALPITPELDAQIRTLLEERAGYREVELTTGVSAERLARLYPGHALTPAEMSERMSIGRTFSKII